MQHLHWFQWQQNKMELTSIGNAYVMCPLGSHSGGHGNRTKWNQLAPAMHNFNFAMCPWSTHSGCHSKKKWSLQTSPSNPILEPGPSRAKGCYWRWLLVNGNMSRGKYLPQEGPGLRLLKPLPLGPCMNQTHLRADGCWAMTQWIGLDILGRLCQCALSRSSVFLCWLQTSYFAVAASIAKKNNRELHTRPPHVTYSWYKWNGKMEFSDRRYGAAG